MNSQNSITLEHVFSQEDFDRFATLSGDDNPIHVDPEFSARTRFGATVAHGLLLASFLRGLIRQLVPGKVVSQQLVFLAPTYTQQAMRFDVEVTGQTPTQCVVSLSCTRISDDVVTCQGQAEIALGAT